jgi:hypothetical protein
MTKRSKVSYAQAPLPFAGSQTRLIQDPLKREWQALSAVGAIAALLLITYGYCVVNSIAQVSMRESALKESRVLAAERATLEGSYLNESRGITLAYARAEGYQDATNKVFVTRTSALSYVGDAR